VQSSAVKVKLDDAKAKVEEDQSRNAIVLNSKMTLGRLYGPKKIPSSRNN
jgi:hypothetical protein